MIHKFLAVSLLVVFQAASQPASPTTGSISGVVRNSIDGAPLRGVTVTALPAAAPDGTPRQVSSSRTDAQGRYSLQNLASGSMQLTVRDTSTEAGILSGPESVLHKTVVVIAGQNQTVDFQMSRPGPTTVTGKIVDQDRQPLSGISVALIAREYYLGALRYVITGQATTDDQGVYRIGVLRPARSHLLVARAPEPPRVAVSLAPANPKMRKPAYMPTWYPGGDAPEGAQPLRFTAGQPLDLGEMRMLRSPAYCVSGTAQSGGGPAKLHVEMVEPQFAGNAVPGLVSYYDARPRAITADDGRFRICDLHSGAYKLTVSSGAEHAVRGTMNAAWDAYGETIVNIEDRDIDNLTAPALSMLKVPGEIAWVGQAPNPPPAGTVRILAMTQDAGFVNSAPTPIPGQFELTLAAFDHSLTVPVPSGTYVKDILYGGRSILHLPLRPGSEMAGGGLRILVGTDGGTVVVKVTDKDGNPLDSAPVVLMPDGAVSEAALADAMVMGSTDTTGVWTSKLLAPGKYWALSVPAPDHSPEVMTRLLRARGRAQEVNLGPGASAQITVTPGELD